MKLTPEAEKRIAEIAREYEDVKLSKLVEREIRTALEDATIQAAIWPVEPTSEMMLAALKCRSPIECYAAYRAAHLGGGK